MIDLQVSCILKAEHSREGITHVGGPANGGWCWPVDRVIAAIDSKTHTFYTMVGTRRAEIHPQRGPSGKRYLRTDADSSLIDNLLSLPPCRAAG